MIRELTLIENFKSMNLKVSMSSNCISCNTLVITNEFMEKVEEKQLEDSKIEELNGFIKY